MTAYVNGAPSGIAGDITRREESWAEQGWLTDTTANLPAVGGAVKADSAGKFAKMTGSDAAGLFLGFIARTAPTISGTDGMNHDQVQTLLVKGYMSVVCSSGTPVKGGDVFLLSDGTLATATTTGAVKLDKCKWAINGKDANNLTEIVIL